MKTNYLLLTFILHTLFFSTVWAKENELPSHTPVAIELEFQKLEALIQKQQEEYQKRPKRKFIGNGPVKTKYKEYLNNWIEKLEKIGNENYPLQAKKDKLYGSLSVTVSIKADGELESIQINKGSGYKLLDENVINTIKKSTPFEPFNDEMRKDTDILSITKTWTFTNEQKFSDKY